MNCSYSIGSPLHSLVRDVIEYGTLYKRTLAFECSIALNIPEEWLCLLWECATREALGSLEELLQDNGHWLVEAKIKEETRVRWMVMVFHWINDNGCVMMPFLYVWRKAAWINQNVFDLLIDRLCPNYWGKDLQDSCKSFLRHRTIHLWGKEVVFDYTGR